MAKKKYDESEGVWRTIGGRRVFIREGQSLSDAMKESGKFKNKNIDDEIENEYKGIEKKNDELRKQLKEKYGNYTYKTNEDIIEEQNNKAKYDVKYDSVEDRYNKDKDFRDMLKNEHEKTLKSTRKEINAYLDLKNRDEEIGDKDDLYKLINENYYSIDRDDFEKIYSEEEFKKTTRDFLKMEDDFMKNTFGENSEDYLKYKKQHEDKYGKDYLKENKTGFENESKIKTITQEEYDKMPKDYKGTLKELVDTAEFRGESKEKERQYWENKGYDVDKDKTILEYDKGGTTLRPVKIKESERTTKEVNDEYNKLSKKMQQDDYYYRPEDDRRLKELRAEYDTLVAKGQENVNLTEYKRQIETDYALDFGDSSDNYRDTKYVSFKEKENVVLKNRYSGTIDYLKQTTNMNGNEILELLKRIEQDKK